MKSQQALWMLFGLLYETRFIHLTVETGSQHPVPKSRQKGYLPASDLVSSVVVGKGKVCHLPFHLSEFCGAMRCSMHRPNVSSPCNDLKELFRRRLDSCEYSVIKLGNKKRHLRPTMNRNEHFKLEWIWISLHSSVLQAQFHFPLSSNLQYLDWGLLYQNAAYVRNCSLVCLDTS